MRCVMVMFDSLNRHYLPCYGNDWVHAPNFERLSRRAVTFDTSYVCSMPCMPARRDLHTARPNFLHRSWGPMEPFDDSVPRMLAKSGTGSHLISDHQHYWEAGGCTYHTMYSTWQFHRGQEGDPWIGQARPEPPRPDAYGRNAADGLIETPDRLNRKFVRGIADFPQSRTFAAGLDFIERNHKDDNWFLQIETFDPHEPFHSHRSFKDLYAKHYAGYRGPHWDWPPYRDVIDEERELVEHMRHEYASLLSMCDASLGNVLDAFDRFDLWNDTMLVVWTDHGFLLGEHDMWAKVWMPFYEEIARTPFFVWDPRCPQAAGQRRSALVQPAIDLGPTLLEFFGQQPTKDMLGKSLKETIARDAPVREAAIFGQHGHQVNVTDGRYVYMRSAISDDALHLFEYTLMPTHMKAPFEPSELQEIELAEPFGFTKGCRTMRIPGRPWSFKPSRFPTRLYDVVADPGQRSPLNDPALERRMIDQLLRLMDECEAPAEQFARLGLN